MTVSPQVGYRVARCGESPGKRPWETAGVLSDFVFPWEDREPPRTEFRALWNEERFYFRFDCDDDDLVLAPGADAKEKVIGSDRVEIFLAPELDLQPYYSLEMDPRGEVLDYEGRYYRKINWDWRCPGLELQAQRGPGGYAVEGSIPLATLRDLQILKPEQSTFHAGVYRAEFSHEADGIHEGWMAWVDPGTEKPDFHVPSSFGVFELVD